MLISYFPQISNVLKFTLLKIPRFNAKFQGKPYLAFESLGHLIYIRVIIKLHACVPSFIHEGITFEKLSLTTPSLNGKHK